MPKFITRILYFAVWHEHEICSNLSVPPFALRTRISTISPYSSRHFNAHVRTHASTPTYPIMPKVDYSPSPPPPPRPQSNTLTAITPVTAACRVYNAACVVLY